MDLHSALITWIAPRAVLHNSTASPLNDLPTNRVEVDHQEQEGGEEVLICTGLMHAKSNDDRQLIATWH
jgi:hypothetical protein